MPPGVGPRDHHNMKELLQVFSAENDLEVKVRSGQGVRILSKYHRIIPGRTEVSCSAYSHARAGGGVPSFDDLVL